MAGIVGGINQNLMGLQALAAGRQELDQNKKNLEDQRIAAESLREYQRTAQEGNPNYDALSEAALRSPQLASNFLQSVGIADARRGQDAANYAIGAYQNIDKPEEFVRLTQNRINYLQQQGRDPSESVKVLEKYMAGDVETVRKGTKILAASLANQGYLDKDIYASTFGAGGGRSLGSTKILDDGTTIQATSAGPVVFSPSGEQLTGQAAADAIRSAQQYGADIQSARAGGRTAATLDARVQGGGEAQRVEAVGAEEGKTAVARRDAWKTQALSAAENIPTLRRASELQEAINTGGGSNAIRKIANYLGVASEDEGELNSLFGQNILGQLKSTFGGSPTEGEREALAQAQASFTQTGKINSRLLKNALKLAEQRVERGKRAAKADKDDATIEEIEAAMAITLGDAEGGSGQGVNTPAFAPPAATQGWSIKPLGQ